ncbi:TIGR04104 family putative zinc finger protein [Sinobaca sp. H24]|uniref:TIGR04104 family putative zinc finger protein n=1 Tax=Sinobaca sp. H24 TaxID=2923376 RepID=UPI0035B142AD
MPVCQSCTHTWGWWETVKCSFAVQQGMTCPYCKSTQYPTARSRKIASGMVFLTLFIVFALNFVWGPSIAAVIAFLIALPVYSALYPIYLTLSNQEEPLF